MFYRLLVLILFTTSALMAIGATTLSGTYQGVPLYVQNPMADDGKGFYTDSISLNGKTMDLNVNQSAYEIPLNDSIYHLEIGDSVTLIIYHKNGCMPKVLNNMSVFPRAKLNISNQTINEAGYLTWTSEDEAVSTVFVIQQYRWNRWINIGEKESQQSAGTHEYSISLQARFHSGSNKFRICRLDWQNKYLYGQSIEITPDTPKIEVSFVGETGCIFFNEESYFQVYDAYGNKVKIGFGNVVQFNLDVYKSGLYYLCYDNTYISFRIKRKRVILEAPKVKKKKHEPWDYDSRY